MTNQVTLSENPDFRAKMREKLLGAFLDMITPEQFDKMLQDEIDSFFHEPKLLTAEIAYTDLKGTRVPHHARGGYGYDYNKEKVVIVYESHMTPFRQMCWTILHEALRPHIKAIADANLAETKSELGETLANKIRPKIKEVGAEMFNNLSNAMALGLMNQVLSQASSNAHLVLTNAFNKAGLNISPEHYEFAFMPMNTGLESGE